MTPPINFGGSQVSGITFDGTSVTEVTFDGEVVFGAIPDPDINQWQFSEGGETTVADEADNYDLNFNSLSWSSSAGIDGNHAILDGSVFAELSGSQSDADWTRWVDEQEGTILAWINPDSVDSTGSTVIGTASSGQGANIVLQSENWDNAGEASFELLTSNSGSAELHATPDGWDADQWMVLGGAANADADEARLVAATPTNDYTVQTVATGSLPGSVSDDLEFDVAVGRDQDEGGRRYYDGGLGITDHRADPWSNSEIQDWIDATREYYVD